MLCELIDEEEWLLGWSMEVLVMTVAALLDVQASANELTDTLKQAPGLTMVQAYRYGEEGSSTGCLLCTTWEDEQQWLRAAPHYNPARLFSQHLMSAPPEQWYLRYLWGYHRPGIASERATVHLISARDCTQRNWLTNLRDQAGQPHLSFAFLARGLAESGPLTLAHLDQPGGEQVLLNLFSWPNIFEQQRFYASSYYQNIHHLLRLSGVLRELALEPLPL